MISSEEKLLLIKRLFVFAFLILSINTLKAQEHKRYNAELKLEVPGGRDNMNLFVSSDYGKPIRGYFILDITHENNYGRIKLGGFDFMDDEIFGYMLRGMVPRWVDNSFPLQDLETISNGIDIDCLVEFNIEPFAKVNDDSTIGCFVKTAVYKAKNAESFHNFDYDVKVYGKLIYTKWNEKTWLDFMPPYIKEHTFSMKFTKGTKGDSVLNVKQSIYDEVKKSISESNFTDEQFNFSLNHWIIPSGPKDPHLAFYSDYYSVEQLYGFQKKTILAKQYSMLDSIRLSKPVYFINYRIPLKYLNKEKADLYKKYASYSKVMQSEYSIILIPISLSDDELTADIIVSYSKLNLKDNIERWSPFKKRIKIHYTPGIMFYDFSGTRNIYMPKENWSANFSLGKDKYDIYGYSDYEKFVDEILNIMVEKVPEEK